MTVLAPILIEERGWLDVVSSSFDGLVGSLRATLGWEEGSVEISTAVRTHSVISRLLAALAAEPEEYWISDGLRQGDDSATTAATDLFPLFADQLIERFQQAALAGRNTHVPEAWILWRNAAPVALFDDSTGVFVGGCRWDYGELALEVDEDFRFIAHQIIGVLRHATEGFLLLPRPR